MKITRIQVDNFLGARSVDIPVTTPVVLIAGKNGAGKSSIREAVRMAITGEAPRVKLKKEYGSLVSTGAKAGGALVVVDGDKSYAINLPKGAVSVDPGLPTGPAIAVALEGQRFAAMTPDERRAFLYAVTGCKITSDEAAKRMLARRLDEAKVKAVAPMVRTGFAAAADYAAEEAKKLKGAWRQLTTENWGGKASEGWAATKPQVPVTQHTKATLDELNEDIAKINKQIGEAQQAERTQTQAILRRNQLQTQSKNAPAISGNLKRAEAELAEYEPKVVALRQRAAGGRPLGLVHDLAYSLDDLVNLPHDITAAEYKAALAALIAYETQFGEIVAAGAVDQEAKNSLPEYERGLEVLTNRVANLKRDFEAANNAEKLIAELELQNDLKTDWACSVGVLVEDRDNRQIAVKGIAAELNAAAEAQKQADQADALTAKAGAVHEDIKAWLAIADACSPDGIPGEILAEALRPINSGLTASAAFSGWASVHIADDMSITVNDRTYNLLSESEQWRVDAMIAQVVANVSGLRLLMLDRFDVLDLPGRGAAFKWLRDLAAEGQIETALVFGTLKGLQDRLPAGFSQFWIENGIIEPMREAA